MDLSNELYNALELKYQSDIANARATLKIYFNNCVGIGEHPQQLDEMDKQMELLAAAEDKLGNLQKHFPQYKK
jgi:hypothetical protein